jgi:hypothetical protein
MIDSLPYQLDQLKAHGKEAERNEDLQVIGVDWHETINRARAMVVIVAPDRERLVHSSDLTENQVDWEWTPVGGPSAAEVTPALLRSSRRRGFVLRQPGAVGDFLSHRGSLLEALRDAAAVVDRGEEVTPATVKGVPPVNEDEVQRVLAELEAMVGLAEVKQKAADILASARARRERLEAGSAFPRETMHVIFSGGAGTGQATVARLFAWLYRALGLLSKGIRETRLSEGILDPNAGQTALNMQLAIEEAVGGVLFIADARELSDPGHNADSGWPAREAVDALVAMAWNHRNNLVIILVFEAADVNDLLAMNPVLPQRFPMPGRLEFTSCGFDDLWLILQRTLAAEGWRLAPSAVPRMRELPRHRAARPGFANARGVHALVREAVKCHEARDDPPAGVLDASDLLSVQKPRREHRLHAQRVDAQVGLVGLAGVRAQLATSEANMRHKTTATATATATARMHASSAHMIVHRDGDHGTIAATGFAVTSDGLFVTNAHVVAFATSIEVLMGPNHVLAAGTPKQVAPDGIDLALVEVTIPAGVHVEPLPLAASTGLEELTELLVLGHAQVPKGQRPRMVKTTVSRNDADNDPVQIDADGGIEEGLSGGPAVHLGSEAVVGVVSSGKGQTVKCIIRIEHVRSMLTALGYSFKEE